jgi:signal transduction histidine kinase
MIAFGIFGILNYPVFYIVWSTISKQPYEDLLLRGLVSILCLFLALKNYWPKEIKRILPLYWYFTLFICLPFFSTFMFLKNHGSNAWVMNGMLVIFLLILLVDWVSFLWLLLFGISIGWICYIISFGQVHLAVNVLFGIISSYILAAIIGAFFSRRKENLQLKRKLQVMESISASMAHELRTPLRTISSSTKGMKKYFPVLLQGYQIAEKHSLLTKHIDPLHYEALRTSCDDIEAEVEAAFTVINMLLINVREPSADKSEFEVFPIKECIAEALHRFPFHASEKELVHWDKSYDFTLRGNKMLITHVLFNLLKNALYYIHAVNKGEIFIWAENRSNMNVLHFKDTAKGIAANHLPHIFERFFTLTPHGTGIGLAFCKMVMEGIGGSIQCRSQEGEYVEFILYFPVIDAEIKL